MLDEDDELEIVVDIEVVENIDDEMADDLDDAMLLLVEADDEDELDQFLDADDEVEQIE